ncbi:MAG: methionine sulfoxide reductase [Clostridiales bacterium GWF2_38_85]|nr:MAG: methionine sulfoxide reductase [Clostridiales bacterium GWF2_38_85]HBL84731.1 methionine sulfoxide reductase [Clostridiales bacterium]
MPNNRKNINLFLMDGEPSGRLKCSLLNWTGVGYKIPRTYLASCIDIKYLKQSGVYFLFGTDQNEEPVVYIGQAGIRKNKEGLLYRVKEPHNTIDYWTDAIMFTTTNDSLGPTEISFLENRFCKMAIIASRYNVKNANDPSPGNLTEEKEAEMEEFIQYTTLLVGVLGFKVFEPLIKPNPYIVAEPILYFSSKSIEAKAQRTDEGFVVLKGSQLNSVISKSCPQGTIELRKKYVTIIKNGIVTKDVLFSSPSAAAKFIGGSSLSGNEMWKTADGTPLKALNK